MLSIAVENTKTLLRLNGRLMRALSYSFTSPFMLELTEGPALYAENILRIVPGKRMVVSGKWNDQPVVAKLFFSKKHQRDARREKKGLSMLLENHVPAPQVYMEGRSADKKISILIIESITPAKSLWQLWYEKENKEAMLPILQAVVVELATQHVFGVVQHDLHLKNFLVSGSKIITIDGGELEKFPEILAKRQSLENLALFFSQLGMGAEKLINQLFKLYARSRGWLLKKQDFTAITRYIIQYRTKRWLSFEKKLNRASTEFEKIRTWNRFGIYLRKYDSAFFRTVMALPKMLEKETDYFPLKLGRSATVAKVKIEDHLCVMKKYNIKNIFHLLRRCVRQTRASHSWRIAHKLQLFGVRTASPIAFWEERILGLRGKSYFLMENIEGISLQDFVSSASLQDAEVKQVITRVMDLLESIKLLGLSQNDLKASNILLDTALKPYLIDLDGVKEYVTRFGLNRAWKKSLKRFLRNFEHQRDVHEAFEKALLKRHLM